MGDGLDFDQQVGVWKCANGYRGARWAGVVEEFGVGSVVGSKVSHINEVTRHLNQVSKTTILGREQIAHISDDRACLCCDVESLGAVGGNINPVEGVIGPSAAGA